MNDFPKHSERDLPPGRHLLLKEHLMREIRQSEAPVEKRRPWLRPVIAAGAVAAVAAGLIVGLEPGGSGSGDDVPPQGKSATQLLNRIAAVAAKEPAPREVRDDQFMYIRSKSSYDSVKGEPCKLKPATQREIWESVDGKHDGLLRDRRVDRKDMKLPWQDSYGGKDAENYREYEQLPTTTEGMLGWLYEKRDEEKTTDAAAFTLVGDTIRESVLPPKVSAAMYRATAKIPGVTVVNDAVDFLGRPGVAITRQENHGVETRVELIFDKETLEYLGEREVLLEGRTDGDPELACEPGTVLGTSATLQRAIVDKPGQRP
ncbi:CU044_5270 family protein [Streptomyces boninensis]|uniref:CU044_5270 family protein n=1 Tax=Streptomyces boninensis TaxID=2039455 RepID=UPI003B21174D